MEKLITVALVSFFVVSATYVVLFYNTPNPDVSVLLLFLACNFSVLVFFATYQCHGYATMGHIAGTVSCVTGCISTIMAAPISIFIGRFIADTALPIACWFSMCGLGNWFASLLYKKGLEPETTGECLCANSVNESLNTASNA
jgi:DHA1 family bicyclomycin/chloramphenicol resistance-like MFS transporter